MFGTIHPADSHAGPDSPLVLRYTGRFTGYYVVRILPFICIFAIFVLLYLQDESRWIFSRRSASKPFSWLEFSGLLALLAAGVVDLVMTLRRVKAGAIALSISQEGISGTVLHRTRLIPWGEIADFGRDGSFLVVRRKPRSLIQKLFAARNLGNINIPANQLDCDVNEIVTEASDLAQPAIRSCGSPGGDGRMQHARRNSGS